LSILKIAGNYLGQKAHASLHWETEAHLEQIGGFK
jgi:hypothetical protein